MSFHGSRSRGQRALALLPSLNNLGTLAGPRSLLWARYRGPHPPTHPYCASSVSRTGNLFLALVPKPCKIACTFGLPVQGHAKKAKTTQKHGSPQAPGADFFSSVAADLALRLGPDSERSGKKVCKKYETLWLHNRGTTQKQQEQTKNGNSDDPQISRPDLRFASRENSENNKKRGRSHTKQKPHKSMGIASRHDWVKPTVSPKYAQTN